MKLELSTAEQVLILRRRLGWTLEQAAEQLGVHWQTLWKVENKGASARMAGTVLRKLEEISNGTATGNDNQTVAESVSVREHENGQDDSGVQVPQADRGAGRGDARGGLCWISARNY